MYLIFYDLDSLAQNAVDIKRFGNTVAVLLYAAALPLFIRKMELSSLRNEEIAA